MASSTVLDVFRVGVADVVHDGEDAHGFAWARASPRPEDGRDGLTGGGRGDGGRSPRRTERE